MRVVVYPHFSIGTRVYCVRDKQAHTITAVTTNGHYEVDDKVRWHGHRCLRVRRA